MTPHRPGIFILGLLACQPAAAQKGGGGTTLLNEEQGPPSALFETASESLNERLLKEVRKGGNTRAGDLVDRIAEDAYKYGRTLKLTNAERGLLMAAAVDQAEAYFAQEAGSREAGRAGDDAQGNSPWWPDDGSWEGSGKSGTVSPGGNGTLGVISSDGDLELMDHNWYIDLGGEKGTDLVATAGAMAINGSIITFNVLNELTEESYTFATVKPGEGRGRFYEVYGMPAGYELSYGESSISLTKNSLAVPELGACLPLMAMLLPWCWARRRR